MAEATEEMTQEQIVGRLDELSRKEEKTDVEREEFKKLTGDLDRVKTKSKISMLEQRNKEYEEKLERLQRERDEEIKRFLEKDKEQDAKPPIKQETIKVGDKNFYTDATLVSMVQNKQIEESEAVAHQQERIRAQAAEDAFQRLKSEQKKEQEQQRLKDDVTFVFNKYPKWDSKHPDHDPNDPIFKKADQYYRKGMNIRAAMEEAEDYFKHRGTDRSEDLGLQPPSAPDRGREKEMNLTDDQKDVAIRMYRDLKNPETGRYYTEHEAIEKYKISMKKYGRRV